MVTVRNQKREDRLKVKFFELDCGELFRTSVTVDEQGHDLPPSQMPMTMLKVDSEEGWNSVDVETGDIYWTEDNEDVIPLEGEVVVFGPALGPY